MKNSSQMESKKLSYVYDSFKNRKQKVKRKQVLLLVPLQHDFFDDERDFTLVLSANNIGIAPLTSLRLGYLPSFHVPCHQHHSSRIEAFRHD